MLTRSDVKKNEWVLFESSGVYMQIVHRGSGKPLAYGESATVLCRFTERNLLTDSVQLSNVLFPSVSQMPDKISVTNNSGTFRGSFDTSSLMVRYEQFDVSCLWQWLNDCSAGLARSADIYQLRPLYPCR